MTLQIRYIICFTIGILFTNEALTQDSDNYIQFFNQLKNNPNTFHKIPKNNKQDKFQILRSLEPYKSDSIKNVRKYSYLIADNLSKRDSSGLLRQEVVNFLLDGFQDSDSGICGTVSELLKNYSSGNFNKQARQKILMLLKQAPPYYHELIKLAGYVNAESTLSLIQELLSSETIKNNEAYWAAQLALARMGNQLAIDFCMKQIKAMEVNDDLIYDFIPDLIYTHQKEAFDFLIQLLHSDEKNCESSNAESTEMILCGYRIMEYLAPVIANFPLQRNESGDIDTNDYIEALQLCRDWFIQTPNYKIRTEKY